jgi:hypothetical protein
MFAAGTAATNRARALLAAAARPYGIIGVVFLFFLRIDRDLASK